MILLDEYLNHWKKLHPTLISHVDVTSECTDLLLENATTLLISVNSLLLEFGQLRSVSSGWRPMLVNSCIPNAAKHSKHITCQAIDLEDHEGDLDLWCIHNTSSLIHWSLWQEHPASTKGWCHLQSVPYASYKEGKSRWFYP